MQKKLCKEMKQTYKTLIESRKYDSLLEYAPLIPMENSFTVLSEYLKDKKIETLDCGIVDKLILPLLKDIKNKEELSFVSKM